MFSEIRSRSFSQKQVLLGLENSHFPLLGKSDLGKQSFSERGLDLPRKGATPRTGWYYSITVPDLTMQTKLDRSEPIRLSPNRKMALLRSLWISN